MNRPIYPLRWCTGGCHGREHHPHTYSVDPVDGVLARTYLCPGNAGPIVREILDEHDEGTGNGYIDTETEPTLP